MSPVLHPTFFTPDMDIPSSVQAPLDELMFSDMTNDTPLSFSWAHPVLITESHYEANDFQSNRQANNSQGSTAGLGIRYTKSIEDYYITAQSPNPNLSDVTPEALLGAKIVKEERGSSLDDFTRLFEPQLPRSWSFGSNRSENGCLTSNNPEASSALGRPALSNSPIPWTFDSISAGSGISIGVLATQISKAADLALQQMTSIPDNVPPSEAIFQYSASSWRALNNACTSSERDTQSLPSLCGELTDGINPAEVMGGPKVSRDTDTAPTFSSCFPSSSIGSDLSSLSSFGGSFASSSDTARTSIPDVLAPVSFCQKFTPSMAANPKGVEDDNSDYEPPSSYDISSKESSPFPSPRKRKRVVTKSKPRAKPKAKPRARTSPKALSAYESFVELETKPVTSGETGMAIDLGSPVFDAHRGITLEDLRSRAIRYSARNPGQEYDKRWLVSFAGKLSPLGELLEDFRCYVSGCKQTNKRRDHILIHLGGHLDQRPFSCAYCPARFLRRNECKRHEVSHSGTRPYVCQSCPPEHPTAFVRQDLLRRHMQRKHVTRVSAFESIENIEPRAPHPKRVKVEST